MRIAIDASPLLKPKTGVGFYIFNLLRELIARAPHEEFRLLFNSLRHQPDLDGHAFDFPNVRPIRRRIPGPLLWRAWQYTNLPPAEWLVGRFDLIHGMNAILPPRFRGAAVLTVHDLYFRHHPEHCDALGGLYLAATMERSLRRADRVIAVSHATRRDLLALFPGAIEPERIEVIWEAAHPHLRPVRDEEVLRLFRSEYCLPDDYILTVSTLEPRKNLPALFEAYRRLRERYAEPPKLVVTGIRGWKSTGIYQTLDRLGLVGEVIFTDYIDDRVLPHLYSAARLFVFPTLFEGFGLPLLEAMACGTPVLASDVAALREIGGDAAVFVPPTDAEGWAEAMKRLLRSSEERADMAARGLTNAARFSWRRAARKTMAVYEAALADRRR
jgi:glycosyltransferase involved in cell wall biosynthesis